MIDFSNLEEGVDYIDQDGIRYLTVPTVARIWKPRPVSRYTVYAHINQGRLKRTVFGDRVLISESDLDSYLRTKLLPPGGKVKLRPGDKKLI